MVHPEALRLARRRSGLSQAQLAKKAGISVGYIAMIELGQRNPRPAVIGRIADALECVPALFALEQKGGAGWSPRCDRNTRTNPAPSPPEWIS